MTVIKAFPCELSGRLGNDDHLCLAKSRLTLVLYRMRVLGEE